MSVPLDAATPGTPRPPSPPATQAAQPSHPARLRRLAAKPLKPLKLAASAISAVRSGASTPQPPSTPQPEQAANDSYFDALHPNPVPGSAKRSTTTSSFGSNTDTLDLPSADRIERERKRLSNPLRKRGHHSDTPPIPMDPVQVAQAARGPRKPLEGETPAALLRVRILGAQGLVAKDRNGYSDPFVSLTLAPATRHSTPVVKRSLNPVFPAEQSTFDLPIYLSLAAVIGGRGLECVVWDKDLMRKEYMGEFCIGIDEWFSGGPVRLWSDNLPQQSYELISTRRRQQVSGRVNVQIGFLPPPGSEDNATEALAKVTRVYDTILQRTIRGGQFGVLGVPAHQGIGTVMMQRQQSDTSTKSGMQVLTAAMMAPLTGSREHSGDTHVVLDEYDLSDDGLSSSDEEDVMEDALEGDEDGFLRESPIPLEGSSPLDQAGARLAEKQNQLSAEQAWAIAQSPPKAPTMSRRSSNADSTATPGAPPTTTSSSKRRIFRRKKGNKNGDYQLDQESRGIMGIVVMEIQSATDLPKLKNAIRVGWDMDPFVVISFGKKVFRTRVIRHSLNPSWDEKLLFHVHQKQDSYTVQMAVLDWDKISGNDMIGGCTLPLSDLMVSTPKPDPATGLYAEDEDGKHEAKAFELPIVTPKGSSWESRHSPTLKVRAKYEPYDALRQRFWRQYIKQYDSDDTGGISYLELTSMLDSLGSTLSVSTLEGFYSRFNKSSDKDELTVPEVVQCLEAEVTKSMDQKRRVSPQQSTDVDASELEERLLANWSQSDPSIKHQSSVSSSSSRTVPVVNVDSKDTSMPVTQTSSPASSDQEDTTPFDRERVVNIKECPLCHRPRLGKRSEQDIVTHLAVCASSDWSRMDRIMASNYVTSSQAQRKLLSKIVNKVAVGSYSLGANSANTIVQDRATGQLQEEKMAVYVRIGIRVLYKGARSQMARARAKRLLKSLSIKQGLRYDSPNSAADILPFIAFHRLDVNEILDPLDSFKTFNEFFYRKLKEEARPLEEPDNPRRVVSMADCRMMAFDTVSDATQIWIKGRDFTVSRLLGPNYADVAHKYDGGGLCIFRLAPQDYHRFHVPVDGRIGKITKIEGEYYTVNPQAIRTSLDVYGENVRQIVPIESKEFGTVMTVWVGAMMVGSILTTVKEGQDVKRGDEAGYFAFGGSTIVCLFERGRVVWDEDLRANGKAAIETLVRVRSGIGHAA